MERPSSLEKLLHDFIKEQKEFNSETRNFRVEQKQAHEEIKAEISMIKSSLEGTITSPGIKAQVSNLTAVLNGAKMSWKIIFALAGLVGILVTMANGLVNVFNIHFFSNK